MLLFALEFRKNLQWTMFFPSSLMCLITSNAIQGVSCFYVSIIIPSELCSPHTFDLTNAALLFKYFYAKTHMRNPSNTIS